MKIITFKTIEQFLELLVENLKKKTLILEKPYKNVITSIWKMFPNSKEKTQTFSLLSSLDSNKNITILFYSDFKSSENVVKEIEKSARVQEPKVTNELFYSKRSYNDHWLLDNIYFLSGNYDNNENKKAEDFIRLYNKVFEGQEKNEEKNALLIFFETPNILKSITTIIDKIYMFQPFILIFTNIEKKIFKCQIKKAIYNIDEDDEDDDEDKDEDDNDILPFFDMNNIFIHSNNIEGYKRAIMPILKVFRYFNQLGDAFFKQLPELINMENLDKEIQYLFYIMEL